MNEDINRPDSANQPVQRLANSATGLQLTTPHNPFNNDDRTWSIQGSLSVRFDYILPCGLLFSNIATSQVFRTDLLNPTPAEVQQFDDKTASDHLPVLMVFNNPYDTPFRLLSVTVSNEIISLSWESVSGRQYDVEASGGLSSWTKLVTNLSATGTNFSWEVNATEPWQFFRVFRVP